MHGSQFKVWSLGLLLLALLTVPALGQGPDVIVGNLTDISSYGQQGGIYAYSVGTESCNIGNQILQWQSQNPLHPVIPQDMFKLKDGRLTHIGASWLKHGFCALSLSFCGPCQSGTGCSALGIGCSDPYGSGLNGSQGNLGPRSQVNAHTGVFPYPFSAPGSSGTIARRIQVDATDLNPALNPGALYFVSSQYITQDDAQANNDDNNASYRRVSVANNPTNYPLSFIGGTQQEQPPIQAWQDFQPNVTLVDVVVPNEGLFIVGFDAIDNGNGTWNYEYAIYNMNSDRSAQSFEVPLPSGATVTNVGFHDIAWHSGEPYSTVDWTPTVSPGTTIRWETETFATNANANAIRWSMLYNFHFTCDAPPSPASATMGLFKPGTPTEMTFLVDAPNGNFIPSVAGLTCVQTSPTSSSTTLSWTNPTSYTSIVVRRDGAMLSTLAGGMTSYTDPSPSYGAHTYTVQGIAGVDTTAEVPCSIDLFPAGVSALTCTQSNPAFATVDLSWVNGAAYQFVNVYRGGALLTTLSGGATSYTNTSVPFGIQLYEISGVVSGVESGTTSCSVNVSAPPPLGFTATALNAFGTYNPATGAGGASTVLRLAESAANPGFPNGVSGFSLSLSCNPAMLTPTAVTQGAALAAADFFESELLPNGVTIGVVMEFGAGGVTLQLSTPADVATVDFATNPASFIGNSSSVTTDLVFQNGLGTGLPVENLIVVGFDSVTPTLSSGTVTLDASGSGLFRRGDANADGATDVADGISVLAYLFSGGAASCLLACDANDDDAVDIADGISILGYLFQSGPAPAAPFPNCGADPTPGVLDCTDYPTAC